MKKTILHKILTAIAVTYLTAIYTSCNNKDVAGSILPATYKAEDGDILLRKGTGLTSRAVMLADGGSDYSHCGIVVTSEGKTMVIHAVPDEPDFEGDTDRVKIEPIEEFFSDIKASKGCIMRSTNKYAAKTSAGKAIEIYRRKTSFDHSYDLNDTTKMYCSELVEMAYTAGGIDISEGRRHNIRLPGMEFRNVILPSDFTKSSKLKLIKVFGE